MAVHTKVLLLHVTLHASMVRLSVLLRRYAYTKGKQKWNQIKAFLMIMGSALDNLQVNQEIMYACKFRKGSI